MIYDKKKHRMTDLSVAAAITTTRRISDVRQVDVAQHENDATCYGDAVYKRLEYLLNEIRSNIGLNFSGVSTAAAETDGNLLLFNTKNELQVYCSQLRVEIIDRLHHSRNKSEDHDDLFSQIEIYERDYLKLLKTHKDYLDLCDRFINLLTMYRSMNKSKVGRIKNTQSYFNSMLINFELLRRSIANKKLKLEKLILKQQKLSVNEYGHLCYETIFNNDLSKGDEHVKSHVSDNKIDLVKTFDYKSYKLTYNQLQRVREVYFENNEDFYVCHTPFYYSNLGFVIQKFSKKTGLLQMSAEVDRKYIYRNIIFDKTCIMLLLKQSNKASSYILQVHDLELNLVNTLKLKMNTNILSVSLSNEKLYVFTEFKLYIYNQNDLKQIKRLKFDYEDYSSFKLNFTDNEFYKANILMAGNFILYQDSNSNLNVLVVDEAQQSVRLSRASEKTGWLKLQSYELSCVDTNQSRVYLLNKKQKSVLICSFDAHAESFEIIDEFFFLNIQSISSIHAICHPETDTHTLVINDFASYRVYFYKF